jgi:hypothetical protein
MAEIPGVAGDNGDHWDVTLDGSGDITGSTVLARLWLEGAPLTDDYKRQLSMSILTAGACLRGCWRSGRMSYVV